VGATPAVAFLIALLVTHQFREATWVLIGTSVVGLAASLILERRIAPMPAFSGLAALLFGGMSLVLHRNDVLQMKMTIVDAVLGALLFGGLALGKNPLKLLLGAAISLPDKAWRVLTIRYGGFFWACAVANEVVRRTQTAEVWATFRVAAVVAAIVFGIAQTPFLMKYWDQPGAPPPPEPPEPGF
jgi:intracellular septation protein